MRRDQAITALQEAFDRIPELKPPIDVCGIYAFGSLPRNVKSSIGDVDLAVIMNVAPIRAFRSTLLEFLVINQTTIQWDIRNVFLSEYDAMHRKSWRIRRESSQWKWPPLSDFVCKEPMRPLLERCGVTPEWLACFTWSEICNWTRYGLPDRALITNERLIQRMLFGFRRGFHVARVEGSLEEVVRHLVTDQLVLIWSPEKPDVAQNLALDSRTQEQLIAKECTSMWEQLQYANAKNSVLSRLCNYYLSIVRRDVKPEVEPSAIPPQVLERTAASTGISHEDLQQFLASLPFWIHWSASRIIPSLKVAALPDEPLDKNIERVRVELKRATQRFYVLINVYHALGRLAQSGWRPRDLVDFLLEKVPIKYAPKKASQIIIKQLLEDGGLL